MNGPRTHHVLIIDDQPDIGQLLSIVLSRRGHTTTVISSPRDALELDTAAEDLSLILVDLGVTRGPGALTLNELEAAFPSRPIVIMSGHSAAAAQEELGKPDVVGFLHKPFRPDEIIRFLEPADSP